MNIPTDLVTRDLQALWHPCSQMKDYEDFPPLPVIGAKESYLLLEDGRTILDAISSWWCKNLGHGHPRLVEALIKQAKRFEHVILANTTNDVIVELSEKLTRLTASLHKVFYASDGSCAVEIALKMLVQARQIRGQSQKRTIMALSNGYHGETLFALAVSDLGIYRSVFEPYLPPVSFISSLPYVSSRQDPHWHNCELSWELIEPFLNEHKETLSAIIFEPIIQGAGGMLIYSQDFLRRLRRFATQNDIYLIADEILTGFGRSGTMFACEHAEIEPDLMCIGKGMTGGVLPMSAVLLTDEIYQLFYDDYRTGKSFLHSHTHTGNALAAAVALECLNVLEEEDILKDTVKLEMDLFQAMREVSEKTGLLTNIRGMGGVVAADLIVEQERAGYQVYRKAVSLGALLRPLGNTIYWFPPLNIRAEDIQRLRDITIDAILQTF